MTGHKSFEHILFCAGIVDVGLMILACRDGPDEMGLTGSARCAPGQKPPKA